MTTTIGRIMARFPTRTASAVLVSLVFPALAYGQGPAEDLADLLAQLKLELWQGDVPTKDQRRPLGHRRHFHRE